MSIKASHGGRRFETLLVSTTATASSSYTSVIGDDYARARFMLDVTAASAAGGDTLDVYLQRTPDDGTTWDDFVHFTQILGNGGALKKIAQWSGLAAVETEMGAPRDASIASGAVDQGGVLGPKIKVKYVIAGTGSFTFSVKAELADD